MAASGLRERMGASSTDALVEICTTDAGDYTHEAIEIARAELTSRGVDVSTLEPSEADPVGTPDGDNTRSGGTMVVLALVGALVAAPLIDEVPWWVGSALVVGIVTLGAAGARALFSRS